MTSVVVPVSCQGSILTEGFVRYRGDDWDGSNILLFQYGTLVKGAVTTNPDGTTTTAPDTIVPIDLTGSEPVGPFLLRPPRIMNGSRPSWPSSIPDLTVAAGTARIVGDPRNGTFGFCPRRDVTSQFEPPPFGPSLDDAMLIIAAKLIDSRGNLGTIAKSPIFVCWA